MDAQSGWAFKMVVWIGRIAISFLAVMQIIEFELYFNISATKMLFLALIIIETVLLYLAVSLRVQDLRKQNRHEK